MSSFVPIVGISKVWVRETLPYLDKRGCFFEAFRLLDSPVSDANFVQDNFAHSKKEVLRGMHIQVEQWQLITVLTGTVLDVLVDMSPKSPTYKSVFSVQLTAKGVNQLLVRPGIAHGYAVISESAIIHYKSSVYYGETQEFGFHWNSKEISNLWPKKDWIISDRDLKFPEFQDLIEDPVFLQSMTD